MFLPQPGWQRVAFAAILVLPLFALIFLSSPAWLTWPFLPAARQKTVPQFVGHIADWAKALAGHG